MKLIRVNTSNAIYYSEDFIQGFECGAKRQLEADIESAPTIGGWIPCSERLPEPLEEVMITWVNNSPPSYYSHMKGVPQTDEAVYFCGDWYWWDSTIVDVLGEYGKMRGIEPINGIDITAWMPLPTPYKEGTDE